MAAFNPELPGALPEAYLKDASLASGSSWTFYGGNAFPFRDRSSAENIMKLVQYGNFELKILEVK